MRGLVFYRAWCFPLRRARCRECGTFVHWVILDTGKKLPLEEGARPLRQETVAGARFDVYAGEASHLWHCSAKKSR